MLKDGQIFTEIYQGDDDKQTFIKKLSEPKVYLVESTMSFNEIIFKILSRILHIMPLFIITHQRYTLF